MKRGLALFAVISAFVLVSGVLADVVTEEDLQNFIQDVAEQKGISTDSIENITEVNFTELPDEVTIGNIDDTHLSLYKIATTQGPSVFLITFAGETLAIINEPKQVFAQSKTLLVFGTNKQSRESRFLETSAGVETSINKGYVMLGKGSITGISTSLEAVRGQGKVQIGIFKNEEQINFGNRIDISNEGLKKDYDIQSTGIVEFEEGDVISAYIKNEDNIAIGDITTLVEISNEIK